MYNAGITPIQQAFEGFTRVRSSGALSYATFDKKFQRYLGAHLYEQTPKYMHRPALLAELRGTKPKYAKHVERHVRWLERRLGVSCTGVQPLDGAQSLH